MLCTKQLFSYKLRSIQLVFLLIFAPRILAQDPAMEQPFVDTLEVRAIEVEVVVMDSTGEPVTGLKRSSFRLLVDGHLSDVDYFVERREDNATLDEPHPGVSLLVFLDDYFTDRRHRGALLKKLAEELDSLGPKDRMAVVRFAGRKLEVISDWTSSPVDLRQRLLDVRDRATGELFWMQRLRTTSFADERRRLMIDEVGKSTSAMTAAMRSFFPNGPGRKILVLVSAGWHSGHAARHARKVIDMANLLGYSIYPLHLGALSRAHRISAANRIPSGSVHSRPPEPDAKLAMLDRLAAETGGELFAYTTVLQRPLERLVDDAQSYYSLGFSPAWRQNDVRHRIEVEVLACDSCTVRHRQHFRDLSRATQASLQAEAALLLGASKSTLEVAMGEPSRSGMHAAQIPVEISIPMDWATSLPTAEGYIAQLDLRVAAIDEKGDRSDMPIVPVVLNGSKPAPGAVAVFETQLRVRRRAQRLVLSLTDRVSGETLTSTLELDSKQKETPRSPHGDFRTESIAPSNGGA